MASKSSSFDIVSTTDMAEVQNACNQTMLEIRQRFDFKGSKSEVELDLKKGQVTILADDGIIFVAHTFHNPGYEENDLEFFSRAKDDFGLDIELIELACLDLELIELDIELL